MKKEFKTIQAKVDSLKHFEIKKYCLLKAKISLKQFASLAVDKYYEDLNKTGEIHHEI
jgi:hypothetical protein